MVLSSISTAGRTRRTRRWLERAAVALIALIVMVPMYVGRPAGAAQPTPTVVVSLTWDDGRVSQTGTLAINQKYGFPATYFINSAAIGVGDEHRLTKSQLDVLATSAGNEIGGHTEHHLDLTTLTPEARTTEVCADRDRLVGWYGADAGQSFAYPFGAVNAAVQATVQGCGYEAGRGVGGLRGTTSCQTCAFAEALPPGDPLWLASVDSVRNTTTLADLQDRVTQAEENGGGWLVYTFHDLGVSPSDPGFEFSIDPVVYDQFLSWLSARTNVEVKTVADAMRGCDEMLFPDVGAAHPFCVQITWLARHAITTGYADGTFGPTVSVSRQAMAAWLYAFSGQPAPSGACDVTDGFTDVGVDHPFCRQIMWLASQGFTHGYPDGSFHPAEPISRQAAAAFLFRLAGQATGASCASSSFADVPLTHVFCQEIAWMAESGIAEGFPDGTFRPTDDISRQAGAAFLFRLSQLPS